MLNLAEQIRLNRYRERRDMAARELCRLEATTKPADSTVKEVADLKRRIAQLDQLIAQLERENAKGT